LFAGGCGRVFEGTPEQMYASLQSLANLPCETLIYCAHEYTITNLELQRLEAANAARAGGRPTVPSTIAEELETNPFLRCDTSAVVASAEARAGLDLPAAVDVFAVIRGWKDGWQG
jgi:hydroxyacylglutathione hydrolase